MHTTSLILGSVKLYVALIMTVPILENIIYYHLLQEKKCKTVLVQTILSAKNSTLKIEILLLCFINKHRRYVTMLSIRNMPLPKQIEDLFQD